MKLKTEIRKVGEGKDKLIFTPYGYDVNITLKAEFLDDKALLPNFYNTSAYAIFEFKDNSKMYVEYRRRTMSSHWGWQKSIQKNYPKMLVTSDKIGLAKDVLSIVNKNFYRKCPKYKYHKCSVADKKNKLTQSVENFYFLLHHLYRSVSDLTDKSVKCEYVGEFPLIAIRRQDIEMFWKRDVEDQKYYLDLVKKDILDKINTKNELMLERKKELQLNENALKFIEKHEDKLFN